MFEIIKKELKVFDYLIIIAAFYMFSRLDFANLDIVQIVYVVTFVLWFIMLAVRVFIIYKNGGKK